MKIAIPSTPQEYFQETEYAVKLAYGGINECWSYYRQASQLMSPHWRPSDEMEGMLTYDPTKDASARVSELFNKHAEIRFSEAILAGTILQAAHMAIAIFSTNSIVPPEYGPLVKAKEAIPFCIGEELYGIPTGLIVLAARNQFCHWNEPDVRKQTDTVFNALDHALSDNMFADLAFDLGNPTIAIYAGEVLSTALGWTTYAKYLAAMTKLIHSASEAA